MEPTAEQYTRLLELRTGQRRFLHWSEERAKAHGITPAQHQLLLAVRGRGGSPTISELAEVLLLRHNSTVELIDRAQRAGLVARERDAEHHATVRVSLTADGTRLLAVITAEHLEELRELAPRMQRLWRRAAGLARGSGL